MLTASATGLTSATTTPAFTITAVPAIGDSYQGGIIFYIFGSSDPGYVAGQTHGLIAATVNQSTVNGIIWATGQFGSPNTGNCVTTVPAPGATAEGIGTGKANTYAIIAQNGDGSTYAAGLARAYTGGGYTDWYLPSKDELNKLYLNRDAVGGFAVDYYWSSTEIKEYSAWGQSFESVDQNEYNKLIRLRVRAVRSF